MKVNMGTVDRVVRIIAGLGVLGAGYYYGSPWGLLGLILVGTAALGFCPAYLPLGINTCGAKKSS